MTAITTMVVMSGFIINLIAVLTDTWSAEKTEPHGEVLADTTKDPTLLIEGRVIFVSIGVDSNVF